jgi:hypothetical protein
MKSRKTSAASRSTVVRAPADVIDVLDRVLDRGIVIDAWLRVSVIGLTLVDVDARVVVASIRTYVREGDAIAASGIVARSGPSRTPAKRPATPRPKRARRERPAPAKVMLRCTEGCTFLRASRKSPIRCPSDHSRRCAVAPVESGQAGLQ